MVPNDAILKLVLDRNEELKNRITELSDVYYKRHNAFLKRLGNEKDPVFGSHSRLWLNMAIKNTINRISNVEKELNKITKYTSVMDTEFRDILMKMADKYSVLLNNYMEIKKAILTGYADAYMHHTHNSRTVDNLIEVSLSVSTFINDLNSYLDIVKLAVRNEANAYSRYKTA